MNLTNDSFEDEHFSINITYKEQFLNELCEDKKYWLQYKAVREFAKRLKHLNRLEYTCSNQSFRPAIQTNIDQANADYDETQLLISDQEVMQKWELPLMHSMSDKITQNGGDILELY